MLAECENHRAFLGAPNGALISCSGRMEYNLIGEERNYTLKELQELTSVPVRSTRVLLGSIVEGI